MFKKYLFILTILMSLLPAPIMAAPVIMGWVENVTVTAIDAKLKAKLDTGATTSSIRADVLHIYRPAAHGNIKKPKRRVIFQLIDASGKASTVERQLVRWVKIKDKDGGLQRRPVVRLTVCLGGHLVTSDVNLAPRQDFIYPILIGRNMLQDGHIAVDAAQTFTAQPACTAPKPAMKEEQ